jgi:AsmA protein
MNKFLKWILVAVGLVAALVIIAAVVLPMVIDPNNYKDEISAAVLKETGRELTIGGDIKWTVFPSIGLGLSDVRLGNRDGFGDEPMFDIGEAEVSVKLMPLFSKKLEIGKVNLSDVSIKLRRNVDGETNWQDLGDSSADSTTTTAGAADPDSFMISGVEISNANVSLNNVDQTTELKNFDLTASNIKLGQPFDLKGGFSIKLAEPELTGDVDFSGLIQTAANGKRFGIEGLQISFKGVEGSGADSVSLDAKILANTDIDLSQDKATLSDFSFALHDLLVSGDLDVTSLSTEPQFAGKLSVAEFNPKSFMQAMGMESPQTNKGTALTQLRADMSFAGSSNSANMQNLTLNLDDSLITGRFRVDDFELPKLAFDFEIDQLNLDDYSAPESTAVAGQASEGAEASDLSVDDFRGFTGGGDFRIGKLIVSGLTATDVTTSMTSNGAGVRFYPVKADFYGGKHEGDIKIDAKGKQPILSANLGLSGVQAAGLLEDLTGTASLLGTGDLFLQIQSDVSNSRSSMQTLSGDMGMSILDGSIVGIDITKTLDLVSSALGQQKDVSGETGADQKTEFAELSMSGVFTQGIFNSSDLIMQSPLLRTTGKGSFNLVDETIDYVLEPVLTGDSGVQSLDKLAGVAIPIRLSGNLYEPDYMVDIVAAIAASQKDLIDQKKNELIDQLLGGKDTAESETEDGEAKPEDDAVKSLLGGLLGGKKNKDEDKDKDGNRP